MRVSLYKDTTTMTKRQFLFFCVLMVCSLLTVSANDGVYFTSGNFLVPTQETDISVSKEILTITIGKDNYARVDDLIQICFTRF